MRKEKIFPEKTVIVLGMAVLWPSLLNGSSFPYSLTQAQTTPQIAHLFLLSYAAVLAILAIGACVFYRRLEGFFALRFAAFPLIAVLGTAGTLLLHSCHTLNGLSSVPAACGVALFAVYVTICFSYWAWRSSGLGCRDLIEAIAASWIVAALANAIRFTFTIDDFAASIVYPLLQICVLVYDRRTYAITGQTEPVRLLRQLNWNILVPSMVFILLASLCISFFNSSALGEDGMIPAASWRVLMPTVNIALFVGVWIVLRRSKNTFSALVAVFGLLSVLMMGGLLLAVFLSADQANIGSLPSLISLVSFQVFIWMVIAYGCSLRKASLMPVAFIYIAAAVALPKALRTVVILARDRVPFEFDTFGVFLWSACMAFLVTVIAFSCLLVLLLRARQPAIQSAVPQRQACEHVAIKRGLTKRETEILMLLRNGYTAKTIATREYISETTVNTHVRKIYTKLGVHSKQGLIELIERHEAQMSNTE